MVSVLFAAALLMPPQAGGLDQFSGLAGSWKGQTTGMFGKGASTKTYKWSPGKAFLNYESKTKFEGQPDSHGEFGHIGWDTTSKRVVFREYFATGEMFKYEQTKEKGWTFKSTEVENNPMPGATARYEWHLAGDVFTEKLFLTMEGKEELAVKTVYKRVKR